MNSEEAKLILSCTRDRAADPSGDRELEQALELLEADSELASWYEQEQAFDDVITSKLAEVEPPADLKASLIALLGDGAEDQTPAATEDDKITWFRRPQFLAAAAAVILLPIIALQLFSGKASAKSYENFRSEMIKVATSDDFSLDHKHEKLEEIYAWLDKHNATCPIDNLPDCTKCTGGVGCKILDWGEEKTVTLICFKNGTDQVVHCFVVPRAQFEKLPDEDEIRKPMTVEELETCGWMDEKYVYLLIGSKKDVRVSAPKR